MKKFCLAVIVIICGLVWSFSAFGYFEKDLIFEQSQKIPSSHASTIVQLPNGDMMAAWYSGKAEAAPDVAEWTSRFERKTGKWTTPRVLVNTPKLPEGNPVLFVGSDQKVYLYYATMEGMGWASCSLKYIVSDDGGISFGPFQFFRKQWGWLPRNHVLALSTGELLFPLYREIPASSEFMISKDGGKTWDRAGEIKSRPGNEQPAVVEFDDGTLMALMRASGRGKIWRSYSKDQGMTWSKPERTALPNPDAGIDLIRLKTGELVLAFNNSGFDRTPLSIAVSKDNGKTWPIIKNVETDQAEYSYPSLCQDADGKIWLTYTWRRQAIGYAVFDRDWLLSN